MSVLMLWVGSFYPIIGHQRLMCGLFFLPPSGVLVILQRGIRAHLPGLYQRRVSSAMLLLTADSTGLLVSDAILHLLVS